MFKQKLMAKLAKKGKELDPNEQKAKVGVIKELSFQAGSMMGDKMKGLHKGLQDSDKSLKHPAHDSQAEHTGSSPDMEAEEERQHKDLDNDNEEGESPEHRAKVLGPEGSASEEAAESPEEESAEDVEAEHADHSPEQLDAKIQHLMALKHKKESGHA